MRVMLAILAVAGVFGILCAVFSAEEKPNERLAEGFRGASGCLTLVFAVAVSCVLAALPVVIGVFIILFVLKSC